MKINKNKGNELMIIIKSNVSHEKIIEVETEDEALNIIRRHISS